jgi:hypothetical protein
LMSLTLIFGPEAHPPARTSNKINGSDVNFIKKSVNDSRLIPSFAAIT